MWLVDWAADKSVDLFGRLVAKLAVDEPECQSFWCPPEKPTDPPIDPPHKPMGGAFTVHEIRCDYVEGHEGTEQRGYMRSELEALVTARARDGYRMLAFDYSRMPSLPGEVSGHLLAVFERMTP